MSDSNDISNSSGPGSAAEPSMEEILASIRRILKEDEGSFSGGDEADDELLVLDVSMIAAPADISSATELPAETALIATHEAVFMPEDAPVHLAAGPGWGPEELIDEPVAPEPERVAMALLLEKEKDMDDQVQPPESLVSEATRNDIANSVGALVHSISQERAVSVSRGGLTIEDIVREEIKPVLKAWLDTHLPSSGGAHCSCRN